MEEAEGGRSWKKEKGSDNKRGRGERKWKREKWIHNGGAKGRGNIMEEGKEERKERNGIRLSGAFSAFFRPVGGQRQRGHDSMEIVRKGRKTLISFAYRSR